MSRHLNCELCNSEFTCGAPGNCWCSSVHRTPEKRMLLAAVAKDCVCNECLEKLALG